MQQLRRSVLSFACSPTNHLQLRFTRLLTCTTRAIMAPSMKRNARREFICEDHPEFRPNVSPAEMFQAGVFGGTYFRDITVNGVWYRDAWREFEPYGWFDGLSINTAVASNIYVISRNRYKVKCGQSLEVWVSKGWIKPEHDSHGWVHWYCRFFLGRRCPDDERQIARWRTCAGQKGRWKRNLIAKCVKAGCAFDDETVSPAVRQLLLHWGYQLTREHFDEYKTLLEAGQKTSFIPQREMQHVVKGRSESEDETSKIEERKTPDGDAREQRRQKRSRNR